MRVTDAVGVTEGVTVTLGVGVLVVRVIDWADEDDIALIRQYQPAMLEAS